MSSIKNTQPPGVLFEHRGSRIFEVAGHKKVELVLVASVNDEELWKQVEKKFIDGFSVYASDDFKGQMISAIRDELIETHSKLAVSETLRAQKEQECKLLEEQLEAARAPYRRLEERLGGR